MHDSSTWASEVGKYVRHLVNSRSPVIVKVSDARCFCTRHDIREHSWLFLGRIGCRSVNRRLAFCFSTMQPDAAPRPSGRGFLFGFPFRLLWVYVDVVESPASRKTDRIAIESLSEKPIVQGSSCAVCFEDFAVGLTAINLPCDHFFHRECIVPWLEERNTCPLCRYELPIEQESNQSRENSVLAIVPSSTVASQRHSEEENISIEAEIDRIFIFRNNDDET